MKGVFRQPLVSFIQDFFFEFSGFFRENSLSRSRSLPLLTQTGVGCFIG